MYSELKSTLLGISCINFFIIGLITSSIKTDKTEQVIINPWISVYQSAAIAVINAATAILKKNIAGVNISSTNATIATTKKICQYVI